MFLYTDTPTIVLIHSGGVIRYIASNLQDSQVEVCFCALRNKPVDLARVHYLDSFPIHSVSDLILESAKTRNASSFVILIMQHNVA